MSKDSKYTHHQWHTPSYSLHDLHEALRISHLLDFPEADSTSEAIASNEMDCNNPLPEFVAGSWTDVGLPRL